jgi:hypothetical protein
VSNASSTIEKIALAALQLSQGKSISAAKFMGEAAESPDLLRAVKTILRASDILAESAEEDEKKPVEAAIPPHRKPPVVAAEKHDMDEVSPVEGFVSRHDIEQEMLSEARDSDDSLEEAEDQEEDASNESDEDEDEDADDGADIEIINARFTKALMNITAAAKKKKVKRKSSTSVKTGKKIKLTPRDI